MWKKWRLSDIYRFDFITYFRADEKSAEKFRHLSKTIYDSLKREDKPDELRKEEDLDQLIIEDFDDEQIWYWSLIRFIMTLLQHLV